MKRNIFLKMWWWGGGGGEEEQRNNNVKKVQLHGILNFA